MSEQTTKSWQDDIQAQKNIAFAAGILLGDVTIRSFLESIAEAVVFVEGSGRIVVTNSRTEELFGYTREEMMGQPVEMLIPAKFHEAHTQHVANFFQNPRRRPMGVGMSLAGLRKDMQEIPVEVSLGHLQTSVGRLALAFVTDIRARRQAEERLKKSHEALNAFAHTVAHDLTSQLSGLVAASDLVSASVSDDDVRTRIANEIGTTSRNLVSVVRELLAFATLTGRDADLVPVDMAPVIGRALDRVKMEAEKRGARIAVQAEMPICLGHGPWIEEIWFNYLANAIKYGGENPAIELGGEKGKKGAVRFWVQSHGAAISAKKREHIFETAPHAEGHGLGLQIVARIAERLGGEVFVESDANNGTRFGFVLQAAPPVEAPSDSAGV